MADWDPLDRPPRDRNFPLAAERPPIDGPWREEQVTLAQELAPGRYVNPAGHMYQLLEVELRPELREVCVTYDWLARARGDGQIYVLDAHRMGLWDYDDRVPLAPDDDEVPI